MSTEAHKEKKDKKPESPGEKPQIEAEEGPGGAERFHGSDSGGRADLEDVQILNPFED